MWQQEEFISCGRQEWKPEQGIRNTVPPSCGNQITCPGTRFSRHFQPLAISISRDPFMLQDLTISSIDPWIRNEKIVGKMGCYLYRNSQFRFTAIFKTYMMAVHMKPVRGEGLGKGVEPVENSPLGWWGIHSLTWKLVDSLHNELHEILPEPLHHWCVARHVNRIHLNTLTFEVEGLNNI